MSLSAALRQLTAWCAAIAMLCAAAVAARAQANPAPQMPPAVQGSPAMPEARPLPTPLGVVPLPQGPPPTGQQAPVPRPIAPMAKPDQPLAASPDLALVAAYLRCHAVTLQEAVAIALYTSRDLATSVAQLQQASGRTGLARAALNPTIGVSGNITVYDQATRVAFGASPPLVVQPQFNPIFTATAALPLDVTGVLHTAVSQAQFAEVAARIDVNRVRNQVVFNVKTAFYNVLRSQAQMAVATDTLNNALLRLSDAQKNYRVGTAPRFDVISADRDVANAQQGVINARAQRSINLAALKSAMGIDIDSDLRITDAGAVDYPAGVTPIYIPPPPRTPPGAAGVPGNPLSVPPAGPPAAPTPPTISQAPAPAGTTPGVPGAVTPPTTGEVADDFAYGPEYHASEAEALRTRPEILEADAEIAAARRGVQYARRSTLPSMNVSVSNIYTANATPLERPNVGALTLGVSLPILDGGLARARLEEARGVVGAAETARRTAVDQTKIDLQQAYVALVQGRDRVAVAEVELATAREAFRLARVRYLAGVSLQPGVSPEIELSNAENTLAVAQSNQINAIYDYNNARAQLDRAVGRNAFTGIAPGYTAPPSAAVTGR